MNWSSHCAAVIPCLNEERIIGDLVRAVCQHVSKVIVVDDGSSDATAQLATAAGAEVILHPSPHGKGAALMAGWDAAARQGFDWAVTLDGDGQHAATDIPAMFRRAEETGARLVIGNRMDHADRMPWLRRRVNRWLSRRISNLVGAELPDSQCGFRLIHLPSVRQVSLRASHFEIESEVLLQFSLHRFPLSFVPIQVIYAGEQSKIHPWRDTWRWWKWWSQAKRETKAHLSRGPQAALAPLPLR